MKRIALLTLFTTCLFANYWEVSEQNKDAYEEICNHYKEKDFASVCRLSTALIEKKDIEDKDLMMLLFIRSCACFDLDQTAKDSEKILEISKKSKELYWLYLSYKDV